MKSDSEYLEELLSLLEQNRGYRDFAIIYKVKEIRAERSQPKHDCETCKYANYKMRTIPCDKCWTRADGTFPNWKPKEDGQ